VSVAGGGPRARRRSSGVGCPCPRLGSGEARSRPLNGLILDLIAPIRPLQLCADGGYQLRFRSLEGTPNYGPQQNQTDPKSPSANVRGRIMVATPGKGNWRGRAQRRMRLGEGNG
jgi:hypothetical protein